MKRFMLCFFAIALLLSASACAKKKDTQEENGRIDREEVKQQKWYQKELKRIEREDKKKEKKREQKAKKEETRREQESKKQQKIEEKKRADVEKELEKERQEAEKERITREKEQEKERKKAEKEAVKKEKKKAKVDKKLEKHEEKGMLEKYLGKIFHKEEKKIERLEKEELTAKQRAEMEAGRKERKECQRQDYAQRVAETEEARNLRKEIMVKEKRLRKLERKDAMANWKKINRAEVEKDYADGMYADLYKQPSWPFAALWPEYHKDLFQVNANYDYATSAFSNNGSGMDLSKLAFGEDSFNFQDILLALKLNTAGTVDQQLNKDFSRLRNVYANKNLLFLAESEDWELSLDYCRNIKDKDVTFGIQIPLVYKAHKLKLDSNVTGSMYTMLKETLNYVLEPKGMSYEPKSSATGIGDIAAFMNFTVNSRYFEKLAVGFKASIPTAKQANQKRLWAPELGSGGFHQFSVYGSALFNKQRRYFNPHAFLKFDYNWYAYVNRRIPKKVEFSGTIGNTISIDSTNKTNIKDIMAHGDKVQFKASTPFSEWDTTIPAFADNVRKVRIQPGPQVSLRLGNMIESFIFRRAFFDFYYDFRAKWKDDISGDLQRSDWNLDSLKENTHQLEHKLGCDFTYQFDEKARLRTGLMYTFAGINVPETIHANLALGIEF
jgi:chemotaxis protein histidine kinase CheA